MTLRTTAPAADLTDRNMGLFRGTGHDFGPLYLSRPVGERTLLHVLRDRVADRPDHDWLVFDSEHRTTFREAWELSARVADAIGRLEGGPVHVGMLLRNQPEFMPTMLGAMLSGGVAVPLNADARGPLLEDMIDSSDARILVVRSDLVEWVDRVESLHDVEQVVVVGDTVPTTVCGVPAIG